jgi:hypothetical protein
MTNSIKTILKSVLPDRALPLPVLTGPFRGATVHLHPRHALRKVLGIYEHELNGWLASVLPRVTTVIDIGANDGYFTLGCAAAFRRLKKRGEILAYEPEPEAFERLRLGSQYNQYDQVQISLHKSFVGASVSPEQTTLNEIARQRSGSELPTNTLIKMDVEGAEIEVISEASAWLNSNNYFLIEVHEEPFLASLTTTFAAHCLKLTQINQKPLPVIGYEARSRLNWWLVSELT